jgi:predicted ATPase/class 3 adenylate cyclase
VRSDLPTGTVTFLLTDVEGSTTLLHALGAEAYADALLEHRRVVREACSAEGGVEVDTQGDAFFFAFSSAGAAVGAAQAVTDDLSSGSIRLRIGLHTGTPLVTEEGYVGDDVHLAARIAATGHGGQVLLSRATRELAARRSTTYLGEHRLKDIEESVAIYQLGSQRFPPLRTISNTNLPHPASSFVGRQREREELVAMLSDETRLLTLSGPGGSGKTRLAIEAASELVPGFKSGVFWVSLAALREPALVTQTIAQTIGADEELAAHISDREMLLLLDNFEQVVEAAPELSQLVEACPNLKLLVTSRELLRIRGEVEYALAPLAEPEAVELFCERARLEPDPTIAELCRRLDDMPLAVELAAARTHVLNPEQILERLSQRLDLLQGGRDADPRQQTLRATIEWSHDLLDAAERDLFARLAVFAGGCTLEAAEEVCEAQLNVLQSLVDKSLVRHSDDRFWMLETIHEFAIEQLERSGEWDEYSHRHAACYAELGERASEGLGGADEGDWLGRLEVELGNLRAALESFDSRGDATALQTLASALLGLWGERGHWREGTLWLDKSLALGDGDPRARIRALIARSSLDEQSDPARLRNLAWEIDRLSTEVGDAIGRARARTILGWAAKSEGDFDEAVRMHEQAVPLARATGDPWQPSIALNNLGDAHLARGDFDAAAGTLVEALAAAREVGIPDGTGRVLSNLSIALLGQGHFEQADELLREALTLFSRTGSVVASDVLLGLAAVAHETGDSQRAALLLGASDRIYKEAGDQARDVGEARLYSDTLTAVRASLGESTAELLAEGEKMSRDEAITYALAD